MIDILTAKPMPSKCHPKTGGLFIVVGDIAALITAFIVASWVVRKPIVTTGDSLLSYISPLEHHFLYGAVGLAVLSFFLSLGHYTQRIPWWNQIRLISLAVLFGFLAEGFASFVLEIHASAWLILTNWVLCFIFLMVFRLIFFRIRENTKGWAIPTVVIGDTSTVADILYAFNSDRSIGYDIHTVLMREKTSDHFDPEDLPPRYAKLKIEYDFDDYEAFVITHPDNFYVVVLDAFRGIMRDRIVETLNRVNAAYAIVPSTAKMSLYEMEPRYFFGFDVMLLHTKTSLSHPLTRFGKRLIDITSSGAGLLMLAPLFAVICLALKLERHEGSIFYGGERVGQNGKLFKCWKFRTMRPNSDHLLHEYLSANPQAKEHWEKYFKLPKDPRVKTKTAHLLRKSSLDEIPQLLNVFLGNMSLVGPRPILPNEVESYGEPIQDYTKVKPGITGLWQVSGRNSVSFQRRVYWDSWYVRNWSLWGDIVIILKTIPAVLIRNDGH